MLNTTSFDSMVGITIGFVVGLTVVHGLEAIIEKFEEMSENSDKQTKLLLDMLNRAGEISPFTNEQAGRKDGSGVIMQQDDIEDHSTTISPRSSTTFRKTYPKGYEPEDLVGDGEYYWCYC